jgi:hypothetical protein
MDEDGTALRYLSIRFTRESLDEVDVDGKTRMVCLPRATISSIDLVHGQSEERPRMQLFTGVGLIALGLVFVMRVGRWALLGGTVHIVEMLGVAFLPLGAWFIARVFRKRHYLLVQTEKETRKLAFNGNVDRSMIADLLERARREYGYPIGTIET